MPNTPSAAGRLQIQSRIDQTTIQCGTYSLAAETDPRGAAVCRPVYDDHEISTAMGSTTGDSVGGERRTEGKRTQALSLFGRGDRAFPIGRIRQLGEGARSG